MATRNAPTLSHLRFIHTISHLYPPVDHSIFRTAAGGKISPLALPIVQASMNNTGYTLHFTGSMYLMTTGTSSRS